MNRSIDPRTNVPTIATLVVAFVVALTNWAQASIPDSVPVEVVASGHAVLVALVALGVGKLAQHFTWASDSVEAQREQFADALDQIASAEDALAGVTLDDVPSIGEGGLRVQDGGSVETLGDEDGGAP